MAFRIKILIRCVYVASAGALMCMHVNVFYTCGYPALL